MGRPSPYMAASGCFGTGLNWLLGSLLAPTPAFTRQSLLPQRYRSCFPARPPRKSAVGAPEPSIGGIAGFPPVAEPSPEEETPARRRVAIGHLNAHPIPATSAPWFRMMLISSWGWRALERRPSSAPGRSGNSKRYAAPHCIGWSVGHRLGQAGRPPCDAGCSLAARCAQIPGRTKPFHRAVSISCLVSASAADLHPQQRSGTLGIRPSGS